MRRGVRHFRFDPRSVGEARGFLDSLLDEWGVVAEDAPLVLSELVTNAVVHSREPFEVAIVATDERLRIEILDRAPALPVARHPDPAAERGRGLLIVAALVLDWGVDRQPEGKRVWAEVPLVAPSS